MIKKIQTELTIFGLLIVIIFFSNNIDISFYKYFSKLDYGTKAIYLKEFFNGITELGDSLWYFLIFFFVFIISFFAKKKNLVSLKNYSYLKNLSLFSFSYILLVGLLTQILKHLVGRPRPNHINLSENFNFSFFTTESAFHSFPSGHSSTIIAVTLIVSLLLPKLKIFFYICGFLIALSRVVVGAHFVTDVIAGAILAIIVYKIFNFFLKKKYPKFYLTSLEIGNVSTLTRIMVIFFIIALFLTIGPEFDIFLSSLFYYGNNQFMIQSFYFFSIFFRKIILPFLLIYIFIFPILTKFLPIQKIYFGYKFSLREIVFIWLSGLITLIVFVNVLLKNMWGRTRPNDVVQFEGGGSFTPWYIFGDTCTSNCSFVSGDASVGFILVVFYFITQRRIYCYLALFFGIILGFVRIMAGGHFLSDVVFSQIVVTASILIFFILYKQLYEK